MKILSLFDGISCGMEALSKLSVGVSSYYASEIDPYAISVCENMHPNVIHVGDVNGLRGDDYAGFDLLMGGSPCQGFSIAGDRMNFTDPRSALYFEFERILKEMKPKYFLLENVNMRKDWRDLITSRLGVNPVLINSSLFGAQNRARLFWTNISIPPLPETDSVMVLGDILQHDSGEKLRPYTPTKVTGAKVIVVGSADDVSGAPAGLWRRIYSPNGKSPTLAADGNGGHRMKKVSVSSGLYRRLTPIEYERLQNLPDGYTAGLSNSRRYTAIGNGWDVAVISHILRGLL